MLADRSDGLAASNLPTILVSCKCDNPENTRQVSVDTMEDACSLCVEAVKTASNVPESARLCLSSMLKAIMASRNGQSHSLSSKVAGRYSISTGSSFSYNYIYRAVLNIQRIILFLSSQLLFLSLSN